MHTARLDTRGNAPRPPSATELVITDAEFEQFRAWLYETSGISLASHKKTLVAGRLLKRLSHFRLASYGEYFRKTMNGDLQGELQVALDLLTTNETYFYREPKHFLFLKDRILPSRTVGRPFRVWSAASSSGEEAYTLAMVLAESLGFGVPWEIVASDISERVLSTARRGQYPMLRAENIPQEILRKYCLKGVGRHADTFRIDQPLRDRISFTSVNLSKPLPDMGRFDVIFLRNVMIYFDLDTKRDVVKRITRHLESGGHFIVSHSESLHGVNDSLRSVQPSIYRKP